MLKKPQKGVTLIEILVTMLVAAIGLLGTAGIQLAAIRYQNVAQIRSQAIIQAQFIAEKIKANGDALVTATPPNAASTYLAPDAYAVATLSALPADPACGAGTSLCTAAQSAVKDMRDWRLSLQTLPGGRGSIFPMTVGAATDPAVRQIVVMWQEKQQHEVGTTTTPNPDAAPDPACPAPQVGGVRCLSVLVTP